MNLFNKSGDQTIGLTMVNGDLLQIALYRVEGGGIPQLLGKEEFPYKTTPLQDRKKLIQSLMSRAGRGVIFKHLIARERVFTKQFQFPSRNPEEIKQMLELRLPREMPFGMDQIVYHSHPIDGGAQEFQTTILVFGVSKEVINEERELLRSFGIAAQQVLLSTIVLSAHAQKKLGSLNGAGRVIVYGVGGKGEVLIAGHGGVQFSRTFNYDTADLAHTLQDTLQTIFDMADLKSDIKTFDLCVGGDFESLKDQLFPGSHVRRFSLHPAGQSLSALDLLMFAAANACAVGFEEYNLLPSDVKQNLASAKSKSQFAQLRVMWIFLLGALLVIALTHSVRVLIALTSVKQKLEMLEPSIRELKESSRSIQALYKIKLKKIQPLEIFVRVHEKANASISLNEFEYDDKEGMVHLKGRTDDQNTVNQFVKALGGIEWFQQVDLQYSESTSDGVRSQFQFAINASMGKGAKNEI